MAKDWVEPNPDHPRDPHTGEFVENRADWAAGISDQIGKARQTIEGHIQQAHRGLQEHLASRTDPLFHQEMVDALNEKKKQHPGRQMFDQMQAMFPQGHDPARDRREDILFALDPIGNYRRQLTQLYDILGVDPTVAREAIDGYLSVLVPGDLERPKQPEDLDYGLSNVTAYLRTGEKARELLGKIEAIREATGLYYFQETGSMLEDALIDFYPEG